MPREEMAGQPSETAGESAVSCYDTALSRRYTPNELLIVYRFCGHSFEQFLRALVFIQGIGTADARTGLGWIERAALAKARGEAATVPSSESPQEPR